MVRKLGMTVATLMLSVVALAQYGDDYTLIDGMKVPLVEKKYVAPTHFVDNWYVGMYGGVTSNWGSDCSHAGFFQIMGPAAAITVGKQITPVSDLRLNISYNRNTGVTDNSFLEHGLSSYTPAQLKDMIHDRYGWNSYGLSIDYMANFTNLIFGFRENRFFYFKGLLGLGGSVSNGYGCGKYAEALGQNNSHGAQLFNQDKYDTRRRSLIHIRAGLVGSFLISPKWNLHIEAVENFVDNSFDSNATTKNTWDGHLDVLVGLTYHFKNKGGVEPGFYYPRHDMSIYKKKMGEVDSIREKRKKREREIEEIQNDTIDVDASVMYTLIAFDEDNATVDRLQQTNIYTTANAWQKAPASNIYITNSTAVDNKLFQKRADAIRDILLERYEVPAAKIHVIADEKKIRPRGNYIVFIVND